MRPSLLLSAALLFAVVVGYSQSPPGINYQGVARDQNGKPLVLHDITIKINIVKGKADGDVEYAETHSLKTNSFGLFTLVIGTGNAVTGDFRFVSWAIGDKWLRVEMDPDGGSSFQLMGAQQFMSVPYAFYSKYSGNSLTPGQGISITNNVITNTGDSDSNPSNELNTAVSLGNDRKLRITDAGGTKEVDLSPLAVNQALSGVLTLGNDAGGQVIKNLGAPVATKDAATKEYVDTKIAGVAIGGPPAPQDLTLLPGYKLKITNNPSASEIDLSGLAIDTDTDHQKIMFDGTRNLSIERGGMPIDISGVNTDRQSLSIAGSMLSLSRDIGGASTVSLSDINVPQSLNFNTSTLDLSINNGGNSVNLGVLADDKQTLSLNGTDLTISGSGSTVSLLDFMDDHDQQDLSLSGHTLSLANDATPVNLEPYMQNVSVTGTAGTSTRIVSISGGTGNTFDVTDGDANSTNELQSLSYNGASKRLTISSGNFVDIPETQNLNQVLTQGSSAGGQSITNLAAPSANTDATNKQYVDNADNALSARVSANYAFKTNFAYSNLIALGNDIPMPLSAEAFDDFNVVNASNFTAAVAGTYVFMVDGSISSIGGTISILYNGTKYPLAVGSNNRYNCSMMFRLTAGQTVSLVADGLGIGTNISGSFFGYKLL